MASRRAQERWILAFDIACARCRAVSTTVATASGGRLETLPLTDPDVQQWRRQSMGAAPAWVPTLLRVCGNDAKAHTGWSMATTLVLHLGPRPTARVLRALGELEQRAKDEARQPDGTGMGRKQFLRLIGGAAAAAGLVATAQSPALAQSPHAQASSWVEANLDRLPRTYAGIARQPVAYRKAIHRVLTPPERGQVWADHFRWYRHTHPKLSPAQDKVVDDAIAVASRGLAPRPDLDTELRGLEQSAKAALGQQEAGALLAMLGPADAEDALANCTCSTQSQYCSWLYNCGTHFRCTVVPNDCGTAWNYDCNGTCY
ncbi:bacteriocin fulvocin C-related protein [Streptomyces goshikiensis]|uniref:bacteriocin fulvocin C-related protein n=1 Tax=Streptomyces goshikiensis TaxID=1942 RepID=UPI002ADF5B2A|nr:bacteriocin fulvocin C-related protein [Streptomyces goshikiensis]